MGDITLNVNGARRRVRAADDEPLLYVLKNQLGLAGPQFGCGLAQCGACSVLVDGAEVRSCALPARRAVGKEVTTLEGLPGRWARRRGGDTSQGKAPLHPVQQAWIDEQVPMCGYCQSGMMIKATELLESTPAPSVEEIKRAFMSGPSPHLCRCGTYLAIIAAVRRAAERMAESGAPARAES